MTAAARTARPRPCLPRSDAGGARGRAAGLVRREQPSRALARPVGARAAGGGARRRTVLVADVRQALREVGQDRLADALTDHQIIRTLDGQEAAVRAALAAGHVDAASLGGAATGQPSHDLSDTYLVLAARDRLAYGRGWRADELIPPWQHRPLRRGPGWPATLVRDAFWLAGVCQGVGTPRGWTAADTLRWLAAERERLLDRQPPPPSGQLRSGLAAAVEGLGAVALLLTQAERQLVTRLRARPAHHPVPTPLNVPGCCRPATTTAQQGASDA